MQGLNQWVEKEGLPEAGCSWTRAGRGVEIYGNQPDKLDPWGRGPDLLSPELFGKSQGYQFFRILPLYAQTGQSQVNIFKNIRVIS